MEKWKERIDFDQLEKTSVDGRKIDEGDREPGEETPVDRSQARWTRVEEVNGILRGLTEKVKFQLVKEGRKFIK